MLRAFIERAASSQAPLQTIDTHVRALNIFAKGEKFRAWILELVLKPNRPGERAPVYAKAPARSRLVNRGRARLRPGRKSLAARLVEALLFHLEPRDPMTFGGAAAVLVAVGVLAAWLPAHRAARLDPVTALREG